MRPPLLIAAFLLPVLAACSAADAPVQPTTPTTSAAVVVGAPVPATQPVVPSPPPLALPTPRATWYPPKKCAGWADKDRPRGSNCYGIMPWQCGADRALTYLGQSARPETRARVDAFAPEGVRWIEPGMAVTDDLRHGRLNVHLDSRGIIVGMDCY